MTFYWVKTSWLIKKIFRNFVWNIPNRANKVYLTFDDGPTPEITEWVLQVLKQHHIKATFFCIGNNIENHPQMFHKIIKDGHAIGNHTFNHLNGWKTDCTTYLSNVHSAEENIISHHQNFKQNKLFRPPYGKITSSQSAAVRKEGYRIIMWDVLSADFDQAITPEACLQNVIKNTRAGSIIIFHDSVKASKNLKYALPKCIARLKDKGFIFDKIDL